MTLTENTREQERFLRSLINMTGPDREVHAGKKFFLLLLAKAGPDGVMDFLKRARHDLSEDGSLDYHYTFLASERELFNRSHLNYNHRAPLFGVVGWAIPGFYYIAESTVGLLNQFAPHERLQFVLGIIQNKTLYYGVGFVLGCALLNAAWEVSHSIKIEQISDAVSQMAEKLKLPAVEGEAKTLTEKETALLTSFGQLNPVTQYKIETLVSTLVKNKTGIPALTILDDVCKNQIAEILTSLTEAMAAVRDLIENIPARKTAQRLA